MLTFSLINKASFYPRTARAFQCIRRDGGARAQTGMTLRTIFREQVLSFQKTPMLKTDKPEETLSIVKVVAIVVRQFRN
jgi:hypothetical protein